LLWIEGRDVVHLTALLRDREKALAGNAETERVVGLRYGALHVVDVIGRGNHGAGIVLSGSAGGEVIDKVRIHPLVADSLAVRDIVADVAEGAGLCGQSADGGIHRAEQ
jgi:hypothetical protein